MALENLVGSDKFISNLVASNPAFDDSLETFDNHMRGIKNCTRNTFVNFATTLSPAVTLTPAQWNALLNPNYDDTNRWTKEELQDWLFKMIGVITMYFTANRPPAGWIECDGRQIEPSQYPQLSQLYGQFAPDLRGYFVRGYDPTAIRDPDGTIRPFYSVQKSKTGEHSHQPGPINSLTGTTDLYLNAPVVDAQGANVPGDEDRPVNIAVYFAVKTDDIPGFPDF